MTKHRYLSKQPELEAVCCDRAGEFDACIVTNFTGATVWVWVCDANTTNAAVRPGNAPIPVANNSFGSIDWELAKRKFSQGVYICVSTDPYEKILPTLPTPNVSVPGTGGMAGCIIECSVLV